MSRRVFASSSAQQLVGCEQAGHAAVALLEGVYR